MTSFIDKQNILNKAQFGFRKNFPTEDALADGSKSLCNDLDEVKPADDVFIDLTKAFDTPGYRLLFKKLLKLGFRGNIYNFLGSYFSMKGTTGPAIYIVHQRQILTANPWENNIVRI